MPVQKLFHRKAALKQRTAVISLVVAALTVVPDSHHLHQQCQDHHQLPHPTPLLNMNPPSASNKLLVVVYPSSVANNVDTPTESPITPLIIHSTEELYVAMQGMSVESQSQSVPSGLSMSVDFMDAFKGMEPGFKKITVKIADYGNGELPAFVYCFSYQLGVK